MAQPIKCRSAVLYKEGEPLVIEDVIVPPPSHGQVRIKMISAGICATDVHFASSEQFLTDFEHKTPIILGHEGAAIVESVGQGVTDLKPGDHVLINCNANCNQCRGCQNPSTNYCYKFSFSLIAKKDVQKLANSGKSLEGLGGIGTFTEYNTVLREQITKINDQINLEHSAVLGCAVATGFYSALNMANVHSGSVCAIWGIGAIGLNVIQGCKFNGAKHIIAIDINSNKRQLAFDFGATEFINSKELDRPLEQYLMEKYEGIDYGFDCFGCQTIIDQALESLTPFGKFISIGINSTETKIQYPLFKLIIGRSISGSFIGGIKPGEKLPELADLYHEKKIKVDELITGKFKLEQINEAFKLLIDGKAIQSLIIF